MKIIKLLPAKLLLAILTLSLLLSGMVACTTSDGENETQTNENGDPIIVGACDMAAIEAEIDSMRISDFTETANKSEYVKFTVTNYGEFIVRLRSDIAPITVENFQKLVSEKFYDGITFHRVIKDFMIQGGDPDGDGIDDEKNAPIKGEFSMNGVRNDLSHIAGVISMARRSNDMDSATSQFFICNDDASYSLDTAYAAFGYVVAGMETVYMISDAEVTWNSYGTEESVPVEKIVIDKICFVEKQS